MTAAIAKSWNISEEEAKKYVDGGREQNCVVLIRKELERGTEKTPVFLYRKERERWTLEVGAGGQAALDALGTTFDLGDSLDNTNEPPSYS